MVYTHSGGVEGIAMDLYRMLSEDLSARLDMERYNGMGHEKRMCGRTLLYRPRVLRRKEKIPLQLRENWRG